MKKGVHEAQKKGEELLDKAETTAKTLKERGEERRLKAEKKAKLIQKEAEQGAKRVSSAAQA